MRKATYQDQHQKKAAAVVDQRHHQNQEHSAFVDFVSNTNTLHKLALKELLRSIISEDQNLYMKQSG